MIKQAKKKKIKGHRRRDGTISKTSALPSDLIVTSFMLIVIGIGIVSRDRDDTDCEIGLDSSSMWRRHSELLLFNEKKSSQALLRGM